MNNITVASLILQFYVDGSLVATSPTNSRGFTVFSRTIANAGPHNVTFLSPETSIYSTARVYQRLTTFARTVLLLQNSTITVGRENTISLTLKDTAGNSLSNRIVRIEIDGVFLQNTTTNGSGEARLPWRATAVGNHSVTARFLASNQEDIGYRPAQDTLIVNIQPKVTVNTSTDGTSTQSVALETAEGSSQHPSALAWTMSFPSWDTIAITVSYGSVTVQGTGKISNDFGWTCAAWAWGFCVLPLPYWNIRLDLNVPNFGYARATLPVLALGAPMTVSYSVPSEVQASSIIAFGLGIATVSMTLGLLGALVIAARAPGAAEIAAAAFFAGMVIGVPLIELAALLFGNRMDRLSFSFGVFLALMLVEFGTVGGIIANWRKFVEWRETPHIKIIVFLGEVWGALLALIFLALYFFLN